VRVKLRVGITHLPAQIDVVNGGVCVEELFHREGAVLAVRDAVGEGVICACTKKRM
jgi:hypothetical protein